MRCRDLECDCNKVGPYFCFDHAIHYGDDGLMCPECEAEICEEHDRQLEEDN